MSSKTFDAWFDEVLPDVPGVTQPVAKNAIRNAAIEFCDRSNVWVVDHDLMASIANVGAYQFEPPNGAVVAAVKDSWFNGMPLTPRTAGQLADEFIDWTAKVGTPVYYLQENTEELILVPMPSAALANAIKAKVALKPSRASTGIERWIFEKYLEEITHGAKGKLFSMQKKPWSDANLAIFHLGQFDDGIHKARLDATKGHTNAPLRTRAQFL
jgi:hypothetical protein